MHTTLEVVPHSFSCQLDTRAAKNARKADIFHNLPRQLLCIPLISSFWLPPFARAYGPWAVGPRRIARALKRSGDAAMPRNVVGGRRSTSCQELRCCKLPMPQCHTMSLCWANLITTRIDLVLVSSWFIFYRFFGSLGGMGSNWGSSDCHGWLPRRELEVVSKTRAALSPQYRVSRWTSWRCMMDIFYIEELNVFTDRHGCPACSLKGSNHHTSFVHL